ncbi:undecaprenyl-diphosphate phosphatase [Mucilaginibacter sp. KACC 22063]|uniref:undecaprenyl-diphosphate phosphatase n=1 Tax=Mucilaginibacter sp. KACC 22063 TaxID=3025666 RepID=UPI00236632C4|nr:undecaprenyl-diphosphate phosphatase [Mucilaginibacter sp. KACC 22063]WDF56398.1 undecaprenyl-diphosphate phosphatase [Mucilaginibacter sp. KACC 22063]
MNLIHVIILAIIEGLTEFLPVSSTGHMVIASSLMNDVNGNPIGQDEFVKIFEVAIQLGAILAVVVLYWKKFFDFKHWSFYLKLLIAVIPALIFGKLLNDFIDKTLGNPIFIATVMFLGGIVLLFVDKWFLNPKINDEKDITNGNALKIGLYQVLAVVFPGLSRSAATIIGGMQQKLSRKAAAEFSFFLAVPTMVAATGYKLLKGYHYITGSGVKFLLIGNAIAFVVALLAIRTFITFLEKRGFKLFGWYRIILGGVILALYFTGHQIVVS